MDSLNERTDKKKKKKRRQGSTGAGKLMCKMRKSTCRKLVSWCSRAGQLFNQPATWALWGPSGAMLASGLSLPLLPY